MLIVDVGKRRLPMSQHRFRQSIQRLPWLQPAQLRPPVCGTLTASRRGQDKRGRRRSGEIPHHELSRGIMWASCGNIWQHVATYVGIMWQHMATCGKITDRVS